MAIPTGITLTPNSGVAPFSVQITGTNLFERPLHSFKETFTAPLSIQLQAYSTWIVAGTPVANTVLQNPSGDAPPDGTPVQFVSNAAISFGGSSVIWGSEYYLPTSTTKYVRRITGYTNRWGFVASPTNLETQIQVMGGAWITSGVYLSIYYFRANAEGFIIANDVDAAKWKGTNPTRVDGVIGKATKAEGGASSNYVVLSEANAGSSANLYNHLLNPSICKGTLSVQSPIFVSFWIYPFSTVTNVLSTYGVILQSTSSDNTINVPGMAPGNNSSAITVYQGLASPVSGTASPYMMFVLSGFISGNTSTVAKKSIYFKYSDTTFAAGKWNHVAFTWNGIALDAPVAYVNETKVPVTIFTNGNLGGLFDRPYNRYTWVGAGYASNSLTPTDIGASLGYYPGGYINDVYAGGEFLDIPTMLKYANLPKVELLKVV